MKDLNLEHFEATSFMGIDSTSPIVIDFTKRRKNQTVLELVGDQGIGKTSTLCGLLYAMGGTFEIDKKQLFNLKDNALDVNLKFTYKTDQYHVMVSSNRLTLKKYYKGDDKWRPENEPVSTLRSIFGPVGLSPFGLREKDGKDQIQYFRDVFGGGEEASKKEKKIETAITTLFNQRRDVNRDIKNLKGALESESLYQNYEKTQTKFKTPPNAKKEKEEYDALSLKVQEYNKAKSGMEGLKANKTVIENNIKELEQRLKNEKANLTTVENRISDGDKYLKENKEVPEKYQAANEAWINLSKSISEFDRWKAVLKKEKEMHEMEELSMKATGKLDELRLELLQLTETYLPKIKGLKIITANGLDDDKEGVFLNDHSFAQLSESEYVDLWCQIWEKKGVNFIFLENTSSLGSGVVDTLNRLAKNGAEVYATRMDRKKDAMEITFNTKID